MKNSNVYCLISICSYFVNILKIYIFYHGYKLGGVECDNGMAGGCFTDVMLYSSEIYHKEHTTEPCRLPKDVAPAWGAVI
jgi:hypothetical protein